MQCQQDLIGDVGKGEHTLHRATMISVIFIFISFSLGICSSFLSPTWILVKESMFPTKKTAFGVGSWRVVSSPGDANAVLRSSEHGGACVAAWPPFVVTAVFRMEGWKCWGEVLGMNERFGPRDVLVGWLVGWLVLGTNHPFFVFGRFFFVDFGCFLKWWVSPPFQNTPKNNDHF